MDSEPHNYSGATPGYNPASMLPPASLETSGFSWAAQGHSGGYFSAGVEGAVPEKTGEMASGPVSAAY